MYKGENGYLSLLNDMLLQIEEGELKLKEDRTGTGTYSEIGGQLKFDLSEGFPLLTSKKVFHRGIIHELLWFMRGETNIKYLVDNKVNIWNEWPYKKYLESEYDFNNKLTQKEFIQKIREENKDSSFVKIFGELGPVYGKQWRNFGGVDQLNQALDQIKNNPDSRRIIVSSWNVSEIPDMLLPPCHSFFQFVVNDGKLSLHLYQRSADMFLGVPFNIASYALLIEIFCFMTGLKPGTFVHSFGDRHIYSNHIEQVKEQIENGKDLYELPKLKIKDRGQKTFEDFVFEDFEIEGYESHGTIKAPVAV